MSVPVIVLGAGGHAKVLIEALLAGSTAVAGIVDPDTEKIGQRILGVPVLGADQVVKEFPPHEIQLANGLGSVRLPLGRQKLFERFKRGGYSFATVVHPSAVIASDVKLGEGVQIMAGSVIQPGCSLGCNVIVNTKASVDHDCVIGDHVHIAPGVTLSGGVEVGRGSHVGTGAIIIQGVTVGTGSIIGAGALVLLNVPSAVTVVGVPARVVQR